MSVDAVQSVVDRIDIRRSSNGKYRGKSKLITREQLDRRTRAAQVFDAIASGIAADLGGEDQLSTIQKHLVEAFAGCAVHVGDINARLVLGEDIDVVEHSQAVSTMVRVAGRIGLRRVSREIGPTLSDYFRTASP